jgi:hypothetical protein
VEELPVEQVEDFSLYRTLVEQDPLPYSDSRGPCNDREAGPPEVIQVMRETIPVEHQDHVATGVIVKAQKPT